MRRPLPAYRTGIPVAAALVLLTGCGVTGEGNSASGTPTPTAESTAEAARAGFCTQAASIRERLGATADGVSDPTELPEVLREAAKEIRAIDAPDEIAADWNALAGGAERFSEAFAAIDFEDPNALATLEQRLTPLQEELETASTNVTDHLRDDCGIDVPTGTATPG